MSQTATFFLTDNIKRLSIFKLIAVVSLVIIAIAATSFFIFEKQITTYLIGLMPREGGKTYPYYLDLFQLGVRELLWIALIILIAWLLFAKPYVLSGIQRLEQRLLSKPIKSVSYIVLFFFAITLICAYVILEAFPNSADEYVYLLQAETMSEGRLWDAAHPIEKSFPQNHIAVKDGIAIGRFPPGWPVILSIAFLIGISPALVNPLLAAISLLVFYGLAKKIYGERVAIWSLLLLAFTGFFIFNAASYFSHTACALESLLFVYCCYLYFDKNKIGYGVLAGFFLGLIIITRYYTAVLLFLPFFVSFLYTYRLKAVVSFFWMGVGALPCLLFFFWYNYAITGNPITPVTVWAYQDEGLGFIKGHSAWQGIEHIIRRVIMFVYWCSPVLLGLYFFFLWDKVKEKRSRLVSPEDYFFLTLVIGYFFYYEIGGNQYGPRFYFEALPFLILFVVSKIFRQQRNWAKVLCYAALVVAVAKLPFIAMHERAIVKERKDVYTLVEQKDIQKAVVLISTFTGVKRPMPIGDLTRNDRAYQNDVLYALDDPAYNQALMNFYKDRKFYRYQREPGNPKGQLIRIK